MRDDRVKDRRAPVIVDVIYSIEWFLLAAAAIIPFLYMGMADPFLLCVKMMLCSAAFVAVALAMRAERLAVLRVIVPVAAVAGCIFAGESVVERIILGALGVLAVICGLVIYFKLERGSQTYFNMLFLSAILLVLALVSRKLEMPREAINSASMWVAVMSALYLPLCIVSICLLRLQDALSIFKGRTEQPVTLIKKRVGNAVLAAAVLVFAALMALPQTAGSSLFGRLFRDGFLLIIGIISYLVSLIPGGPEMEGAEQIAGGLMPGAYPEESSQVVRNVLTGLVGIALIALSVWVLIHFVRLVWRAIREMLNGEKVEKQRFSAQFDTVEKIQKTEQKQEEDRHDGRSNAAKVRRIYRKRITAILGKEKNLRNSLTPAEIIRLCKKKGTDVTELTELYRKARYTRSCTDEDVKAARRL